MKDALLGILKEYSTTPVLGLFLFLLYAIGFIVWNQYLIPFGFFEYNLLQTRFIAAGLIFFIILLALLSFVDYILFRFGIILVSKPVALLLIFLLFVILFTRFQDIFVVLPQWSGGAKPIPTTILGTDTQIEYLQQLGVVTVPNADGKKKSVQTGPVCLIYQNDRYIVFQSISASGIFRNTPLSRDQFIGFSSVDSESSQKGCSAFQ